MTRISPRETLAQRSLRGDSGFSLIELMVVIGIMGIIAAIAVPIFLNNQKSANDNSVRSDMQVIAQGLRSISLQHPTAPRYVFKPLTDTSGQIYLDLNENGTYDEESEPGKVVSRTKGNIFYVSTTAPGKFVIYGWNPEGRHYSAQDSAAKWESMTGGFAEGTHNSPQDGLS